GEGPHRITAIGQRLQQAFLLQPHQGRADRRARDAQALDQRQLGDARTAWQFAGQDHLAQSQLGLDGLRAAGFLGRRDRNPGTHGASPVYIARVSRSTQGGVNSGLLREMADRWPGKWATSVYNVYATAC